MLKKLQKVLVIAIMIVAIMCTMSFATDEQLTTTGSANPEAEAVAAEDVPAEGDPAEEVPAEDADTDTDANAQPEMVLDDVYLLDATINYDKIVDGNAFVMGKDVTISSVIGGDLFVLGDSVNLTEKCVVYGNLYLLANTAKLDCYVYGGNLYAACSELTVGKTGAIYRDLKLTAAKLNFDGAVGRNAFISANEIQFGEDTKIYGTLNYSAPNAVEIPSGAVSGEIQYAEMSVSDQNGNENPTSPVVLKLMDLAFTLIYTLAVFGLIVFLARNFLEKVQGSQLNKVGIASLKGLIVLFATPVIAVLLMFTVFGLPVSFALLAVWALLVFGFASVVATINIASLISAKVPVLAKAHGLLGVLAVTVILWIINLIPVVGGIVNLLTTIYGLGLVFSDVFKKSDKVQETTTAE